MSAVDQAKNAAQFIEDRTHEARFDELIWMLRQKRDEAALQVPEWEQLRDLASAIKEHTLSNLGHYLEMFEASAQRNGVTVHWARDVGPAFQKTPEDVAALFSKVYGSDAGNADPVYLAHVMREHTRPLIIEAKAGMTGANFAIAETGAIVTVTNEGNADLSGERA